MKAREVNRKIESLGGSILRQRGSHRMYIVTLNGETRRTTVAQHPGDIPKGTLHQIEKDLSPVLGEGWLS